MTNLSPATQAVLDAFTGNDTIHGLHLMTPRLAAALRATADQVFPLTKTPWGITLVPVLTAQESRARLLAIAAELEAHQ